MTISQMLKGKKAYEKEYLLDDDTLDTAIVDKLANDAAKSVRNKAVNHKNISNDALYKFVTNKKNFESSEALNTSFKRLSLNSKVEYAKTPDFVKIIKHNDLEWSFMFGFDKDKSAMNDLMEVFVELILDGARSYMIKSQVLINYDVKGNKHLFEYFKEKDPDMLIKFWKEVKLSTKETDDFFDYYLEKTKYSWYRNPYNDLGAEYIENMSAKNLTKLLSTQTHIDEKSRRYIISAKNFNSSHTLQFLEMSESYNDQILYIAKEAPLDKKTEQLLEELIKMSKNNINGTGWDHRLFSAWCANKTQTKKTILRLLKEFVKLGFNSVPYIRSAQKTGLYNDELVEFASELDNDFDQVYAYTAIIQNGGFSSKKARQIWDKFYKGEWKSAEINESENIYSFEERNIRDLLIALLTKSPISAKLGVEYFELHGDDRFIPEDVKDIFLF